MILGRIRGATQNYFKQLGTITLKLSYGGNTVNDTITIVDGQLVVPILIRWNGTAALRNDLTYPATLNQVDCAPGKEEYSSVGELNSGKEEYFGGQKTQYGKVKYLSGQDLKMVKEEYSGCYDTPMAPDYIKDLTNDPSDEQIDQIKCEIIQEFQDVFSDGGAVLKPMACEPSEIDVVPEAV